MFLKLAEATHTFYSNRWGKSILVFGLAVFVFLNVSTRNDLDIFLSASSDLFTGENIFEKVYYGSYHYYYSNLFATLIYSLTWLPVSVAKALWISTNILLILRILKITLDSLQTHWITPALRTFFAFLIVVFCLRFLRSNLCLCQLTIAMLVLSLEGIYRIQKGQILLGACLLAFAINIKILPIVLLPYLLYRAQWKATIYALGAWLLLMVLPALWLGMAHNNLLISSWWQLINPAQTIHIIDTEETSFHSLPALLPTLLSADLKVNLAPEIRRHILDLDQETIEIVISVTRLFFVLLALWFLRTRPFVAFGSKLKTWWELSYLLLAVPLLFPHQQQYAFLFALPAIAYLLHQLMEKFIMKLWTSKDTMTVVAMVLVYFAFNLSLLFGVYNVYYNHFKIVTYGALLLVLVLAARGVTERKSHLNTIQ